MQITFKTAERYRWLFRCPLSVFPMSVFPMSVGPLFRCPLFRCPLAVGPPALSFQGSPAPRTRSPSKHPPALSFQGSSGALLPRIPRPADQLVLSQEHFTSSQGGGIDEIITECAYARIPAGPGPTPGNYRQIQGSTSKTKQLSTISGLPLRNQATVSEFKLCPSKLSTRLQIQA